MNFATPQSTPPKYMDSSFCETPLHKRQRLFSPQSPEDLLSTFRPTSLFSQDSPSSHGSPNTSCDSVDSLLKDPPNDSLMVSPPRLERLQLFDYPRTPLSIARSSGVQVQTPGKSVQRPTKSLFK